MKRRMLIKRRDGVRQHYHIGRIRRRIRKSLNWQLIQKNGEPMKTWMNNFGLYARVLEELKKQYPDKDVYNEYELEFKKPADIEVHFTDGSPEIVHIPAGTKMRHWREFGGVHKRASARPWVGGIEKETLSNDNFRKVIHTGEKEQLVLMSLKPGEDIGDEVHPRTDQFIRIESGTGKVVFNEKETHKLDNGDATVITAGNYHNIINTSKKKPLKLYTLYAPPHHKPGTIQKNKPAKD